MLPAQATLRADHPLPPSDVVCEAAQPKREPCEHGDPEEYPDVTGPLKVLYAGPYVAASRATADLETRGPHHGPL